MEQHVFFGKDGIDEVVEGINIVANAVKSTLGACGKNVIIRNSAGNVHISKDGVTVANSITLSDELKNIGASLVKEVASKTLETAGDGTTTSTILTQALINYGRHAIKDGGSSVDIIIGMNKTVEQVVKYLQKVSKSVDSNTILKQIVTISANNDEYIGKIISETFLKIGNSGIITLEDSKTSETFVEISTGLEIDRGYISSYFITNDSKKTVNFDNPFILISDKKISKISDIINILEISVREERPLLIIAEDIDGDALSTLVINKLQNSIKVAAIKSPGFGLMRKELLQDIAAYTGGTFVSENLGMNIENTSLDMLGEASKIIISKDSCNIIKGNCNPEELNSRKAIISSQIIDAEEGYEKENLKKRLALLSNNAAVLNIGGITEVEILEKKDRIDDAIRAAYSAIKSGFVSGGCSTYIHAIKSIEVTYQNESEKLGGEVVKKALLSPFKQLLKNCNVNSDYFIKELSAADYGIGYNIKTSKIENLINSGVIDATKVLTDSLVNAASVATTILNSECVVLQNIERLN